MRRSLTLLAAALLAACILSASASPGVAAGAARSCSNTYGGDAISVRGVSCRRAHQVVRAWGRRYKADGRTNRTVLRYRCRGSSNSIEGLVMRCKTRWSFIRFYANVP